MFRIDLNIENRRFTGIEAVDECRRLGLPAQTELEFHQPGSLYVPVGRWFDVDEAFARAWFKPDATLSEATVPVDMLTPEDVLQSFRPQEGDLIEGFVGLAELAVERAKELYVAARFRACREQVRRLKAKIAELESQK